MLFNVLITMAFVELCFVLKILNFVLLGLTTFCSVAFCSLLFIVISYTLAYRGFACLHLLFLKNTNQSRFFHARLVLYRKFYVRFAAWCATHKDTKRRVVRVMLASRSLRILAFFDLMLDANSSFVGLRKCLMYSIKVNFVLFA